MMCEHRSFQASVSVNRLEDVGQFTADIRVRCLDCDTPFRFVGLPAGVHMALPTVSVDGLELRAPIVPAVRGSYDLR